MRPPCLLPVYFLFTVFEKQAIEDESFAKILFTFYLLLVYFLIAIAWKPMRYEITFSSNPDKKENSDLFRNKSQKDVLKYEKKSYICLGRWISSPASLYIGRPVRCKCLISIPRSCLAYGHRNNEWFLTVPCRTLSFPFPEISL